MSPQALAGHNVHDHDPAAQPVHPVPVKAVDLAGPQPDVHPELGQDLPLSALCLERGIQSFGLLALEELDRPRFDLRQLQVVERVDGDKRGMLAHRGGVELRHDVDRVVDRGRAKERDFLVVVHDSAALVTGQAGDLQPVHPGLRLEAGYVSTTAGGASSSSSWLARKAARRR